ncbi:MAG TPA: TPM domain-containing protein [bacterium]|nr:TPM domain-containing protein [bacterium]HOL49704.1 TPM domain-containing protein [bacterium]HPO52406.1 TPM domain-containing protein [bacterium]
MKRFSSAILSFLFLLLLSSPSYCSKQIPSPSGLLNDFAGILTSEEQKNIEDRLLNIEKEKKIEMAVVILNSLEGRNIEEYANELFNQWGIGKKNQDNGVLLLISINERKIRIEVGYGLEASLTDGRCGSIIRNQIAPAFRNGKYAGGIIAGINAIEDTIAGKVPADDSGKDNLAGKNSIGFLIIWQLFCLIYASMVAGFIGFIVILLEIVTFNFLFKSSNNHQFFYMLALLIPFFTNFVLFFILSIFNISYTLRGKKIPKRRWLGGLPSSSGSGRTSSGGGFGGGSSGGGGATGGW